MLIYFKFCYAQLRHLTDVSLIVGEELAGELDNLTLAEFNVAFSVYRDIIC